LGSSFTVPDSFWRVDSRLPRQGELKMDFNETKTLWRFY
jgi:hypothetical protein